MVTYPELEANLRECAELHEQEVRAAPDLNRRIMARLAITPRAEPARRSIKRDLLLSVLVAASILGLAIALTVGIRSHFLQAPVRATQKPVPSTPAVPGSIVMIDSAEFISPEIGWLNESRTTQAGPSVVFKTTDGGRDWSEQLRWQGPAAAQMVFHGNDGIVVGQGGVPLFRTTDGGAHWQREPLPTNLQDGVAGPIYFRDPSDGWMMAYLQETYSDAVCAPGGCPYLGVFFTSDGGQHWVETARTKPQEMLPGLHLQGQLRFWDARNGWLVGDSGSGQLLIYLTHDGGATWRGVSLQSPPMGGGEQAIVSEPPHFFTNRQGLLVVQTISLCQAGSCPSPQSTRRSYLYTTSDGGDHWSTAAELPAIGSVGPNSMFFLDTRHLWMVAGSTVASSTDGGQHWTIHRNVVPNGLFLSNPQFSSATDGWLVAISVKQGQGAPQFALYRTSDGGSRWVAVAVPTSSLAP